MVSGAENPVSNLPDWVKEQPFRVRPVPGGGAPGLTLPAFPAPHRPCGAKAPGCGSGVRHPCRTQDARGGGLAGTLPALQAGGHADQRVVAEQGRTRLCRDHVKAHPRGQLFQRRQPPGCRLRLPSGAKQQTKALHLDTDRRAQSALDRFRENRRQPPDSEHPRGSADCMGRLRATKGMGRA